ncbi:DUF1232 domain-containing protein [candidate division KSB1 bacterium]|nr:DUF1232 domain-containing protein [candidate division KSB1 bacterium]MBL7094600.1 DUF1232 domain-containing protein [candidate division KSB1 bacterium]
MAFKFDRTVRQGFKNPAQAFQLILNLPKIIKLIYRLFKDNRVPFHLKGILLLALAYAISPLDLIPDFIMPIIGQIDDIIILIAASKYFLKNCPAQIVDEHVQIIDQEK